MFYDMYFSDVPQLLYLFIYSYIYLYCVMYSGSTGGDYRSVIASLCHHCLCRNHMALQV